MRTKFFAVLMLLTLAVGISAHSVHEDTNSNQEIVVKTVKINDNVYMLQGRGGNIGVSVGPTASIMSSASRRAVFFFFLSKVELPALERRVIALDQLDDGVILTAQHHVSAILPDPLLHEDRPERQWVRVLLECLALIIREINVPPRLHYNLPDNTW